MHKLPFRFLLSAFALTFGLAACTGNPLGNDEEGDQDIPEECQDPESPEYDHELCEDYGIVIGSNN